MVVKPLLIMLLRYKGLFFFHFVVAGFCSSSQNVHFLSVSFGFFYGDDLRSRRICLRCTREV